MIKKVKIIIFVVLGIFVGVVQQANTIHAKEGRLYYDMPYGVSTSIHDKWGVSYEKENGIQDISNYARFQINDQFVYCLSIRTLAQQNAFYKEESFKAMGITQQHKEMLGVISSLGYGYNFDVSEEMDFATQIRIWQYLHSINPTVHPNPYNIHPDIQSKINVINQRLHVYQSNIIFDGKHIELDGFGEYYAKTLNDVNNTLNEYVFIKNEKVQISSNASQLKFWVNDESAKVGEVQAVLFPTMKLGKSIAFMSPSNSQEVGYIVAESNKRIRFTYEVKTSNLVVEKQDIETHEVAQGDAKLEGATYELIHKDTNKKIGEYQFQDKSQIEIKNLGKNTNYILKEKEAPLGYEVDSLGQEVYLQDTQTKTIVYDEVKKAPIRIEKVSTNKKNQNVEKVKDITFVIQLKSDVEKYGKEEAVVYDTLLTDEEGLAQSIELPYGTYICSEYSTREDLKAIEEFEFTIDDEAVEKFKEGVIETYNIDNPAHMASIKFTKIDGTTKEAIETDQFTLGLCSDETCDEIIEEQVIAKDGFTTFENMRFKTYYFKELVAPSGYMKSNDIIKVVVDKEVKETNYEKHVEIENHKIPTTGDETRLYGWIGILCLSITCIGAVVVNKKTKKDS